MERSYHATGLQELAQRVGTPMRAVIGNLGHDLYGIESLVSDGEVRRIYIASDAKFIRKQAEPDCFPANRLSEIKGIIDPANA